ncbi:MAG: hypothetical protein WB630_20300 [Candidatus Acidiferrales bacterium]
MAVIVLAGLFVVCGFFLYVLVQFWRDEKYPRRPEDLATGFPIVASGQIVGPLPEPQGHRLGNAARQKDRAGSDHRRDVA